MTPQIADDLLLHLSAVDVAKILKIGVTTARQRMRDQKIRSAHRGGHWRTCQRWVLDYMENGDYVPAVPSSR